MSIYNDAISVSLGVRPIQEFFPDFDLNPEVPEDALKMSNRHDGELNPFYGLKHTEKTKQIMKEKRRERYENGVIEGMTGKNHSKKTREVIRQKAKEQFSDPKNREYLRQKAKEQYSDPEQRFKAGNGKRGKSWYCNYETGHTVLCFPSDKPDGYVKGRIYK